MSNGWKQWNRRSVLLLAAGAGFTSLNRLSAFSSDFWNKKDPEEWSGTEIDELTNKSPWAKEVAVSAPSQGGGGGRGGLGFPGLGGGGRRGGGGGGGGMPGQSFKGIVRWESAKPILDALKTPLPEGFANHYVISVGGIPLDAGSRRRNQSQDDGSQSVQNTLDRLKGVSIWSPKKSAPSSRRSWCSSRLATVTCTLVSPRIWLRFGLRTKRSPSPRCSGRPK